MSFCTKPKILIVCGATSSGKSDFAVRLAQKLDGEIIGADSVQIYRGLNIGSGKITKAEMQAIPHHMIDILDANQEFSVNEYVCMVQNIIKDITNRGKLPIIAGGTALYINSLLLGHNFAEAQKDEAIRSELKMLLESRGKEYIFAELQRVDPISANKISQNDTKRVIRALEIYRITGIPKSQAAKTATESPYDYKMIVLDRERDILYERINARVDTMFQNGLIDEVRSLLKYKDCQSMQAIGYKETVAFLSDIMDLQTTKELIKSGSRHYAKRQLTFFRGMKFQKTWHDASNPNTMTDILYELSAFL